MLLCLRPKGSSLTLAAQVKGLAGVPAGQSHCSFVFNGLLRYAVPNAFTDAGAGNRACPCWGTCLIWKRRWWKAAIWACVPLGDQGFGGAPVRCGGGAGGDAGLASFFALGRGPARPLPDRETEPGALCAYRCGAGRSLLFYLCRKSGHAAPLWAQLLPSDPGRPGVAGGSLRAVSSRGYLSCMPGRWRKTRLAARWRQR